MNMENVVDLVMADPQTIAWTHTATDKRNSVEAKITTALPKIVTSYDFPFVMRVGTNGVTIADHARYVLKGLNSDCRDVQDILYDTDEKPLIELDAVEYRNKYAGQTKPTTVIEWYPDGEDNGFPAVVLVGTPATADVTFKYPYRRKTMPVTEFPDQWIFVLTSATLYELFGKGPYGANYDKMMGDTRQMIDDYDRGGITPKPVRMDSEWSNAIEKGMLSMGTKKILWLLALLTMMVAVSLLAVECDAQTTSISARLDSLRLHIYTMSNVPDGGDKLTTSKAVERSLNRSIMKVCVDFPAIEKTATVSYSRHTEGAALPLDFLRIQSVYRMVGDSVRIPLLPLPEDSLPMLSSSYDKNIHRKNDNTSPPYYRTFADSMYLHPKYGKDTAASGAPVDSFLVFYYARDSHFASGVDTTVVEKEYLDAVLYNAASTVCAIREDYNLAAWWKQQYKELKDEQPVDRAAELKQ